VSRRKALSTLREISEINLTPLMDLTFILLITFIITFPLIEQGIPVNLPRGEAQEIDPHDSRTISIDVKGKLYLDDVQIERAELAREMTLLGEADPNTTIMVRADRAIQYGELVDILRILHDARIARMALVTQVADGQQP